MTEKDQRSIAVDVIDQLFLLCIRLGLQESVQESVLSEAIRIVASDIAIADWTGFSLVDVIEKPEIGLQELSPRVVEATQGDVWKTVRTIVSALDRPLLTSENAGFSPVDLAKYLEAVHVITVYGDMKRIKSGVQPSAFITKKKANGAFYTPSTVAGFISEGTIGFVFDDLIQRISSGQAPIESLKRLMSLTVVDPACGPGTFLLEALKTMQSRYALLRTALDCQRSSVASNNRALIRIQEWLATPQTYVDHQVRLLYGVDIDAAAAEIASISLAASAMMPKSNLKSLFLDRIKAGDSLVSELPPASIHPSDEYIHGLLVAREHIRHTQGYNERKTLYMKYRETIRTIQQESFVGIEGRRATEILPTEQLTSAFCWELEFPEVFFPENYESHSGFSSAIMNPPYDILKLNRSEYVRPGQGPQQRESALREFQRLKEIEKHRACFFRQSRQYQWSADNVINLYRLMIERAIRITSPDATLGFIVPSTLLCDSSSTKLRRTIFKEFRVLGIDDFAEKANVFEGVTQAVCILRLDKSSSKDNIPIAVHSSKSITDIGQSYHMLPVEMIESVSGSSLSLPRVPYESWGILKKIHKWPSVAHQEWIANRRGELDLTLYKQFITFENTGTRLVRGNHIDRYAIRWKCEPKECYVHSEGFFQALGASSKLDDMERSRIAGQQICNMSQKWRLKFGVVSPKVVLGNSCNYLLAQGTDNDEKYLLFLLSLMNSHLLNWRFKITSTNNHVNNNEIDTLPIPNPFMMDEHQLTLVNQICRNAKRLVSRVEETLMNETEGLVFALYGLGEQEALTVLEYQRASPAEKEGILRSLSRAIATTRS